MIVQFLQLMIITDIFILASLLVTLSSLELHLATSEL